MKKKVLRRLRELARKIHRANFVAGKRTNSENAVFRKLKHNWPKLSVRERTRMMADIPRLKVDNPTGRVMAALMHGDGTAQPTGLMTGCTLKGNTSAAARVLAQEPEAPRYHPPVSRYVLKSGNGAYRFRCRCGKTKSGFASGGVAMGAGDEHTLTCPRGRSLK